MPERKTISRTWVDITNSRQLVRNTTTEFIGASAVEFQGPMPERTDERGFDNAGFVLFVLNQSGIHLPFCIVRPDKVLRKPRSVKDLFEFYGKPIDSEDRMEGDLVFLSEDGTTPHHIGILLNENEFVHSPGIKGKKVSKASLKESLILGENSRKLQPLSYKRIPELIA